MVLLNMYVRWVFTIFVGICCVLQIRNFNKYRVEKRRKHDEARVYLNSDVCVDAVTRSQLGTFNLCESAEHIVNESPMTAAFYDIINDWYPCGHGRCDGVGDWLYGNLHWFVMMILIFSMMFYFKYVEHQRDLLYTKMRLPLMQNLQNAQHVD